MERTGGFARGATERGGHFDPRSPDLAKLKEPSGPARAYPTGTVTLMFTDIEGSTELLHQVGDEHYEQLLAVHQRIMRATFDRHEGSEVDTQGDSFFVAFPRAWNAVNAAVEAQRDLAAYPWSPGEVIRVRIGIHTGEPRLVNDHDYVGLDVHRGARVGAAGHGGQVLISERTHAMMAGIWPEGVTLKDLGEHRLKGLAHPEHIYQLIIDGFPAEFPALKTLELPTNNLPQQLTSFVGREREVTAVKQLLSRNPLVSLLGTGGAGKTRLSLQVASQLLGDFPQGVWFVELAPLTDPDLVARAVATTLNVRELPGRPVLETVIEYTRTRTMLLVFDNCEHVIQSAARVAHALLRTSPQLRILASSREPLGVAGEALYRVPPLARPPRTAALEDIERFEATRLFVERATAARPGFNLNEITAPPVIEIVNRLDGIPLAIELAAARVKVIPVEQIAARIDDRFRLLTGGSRTGLPHHQTLRATIDWSYDLLVDEERAIFRRASVFAGGFTLEGAERVCSGGGIDGFDVLDLLSRLVDKSLFVAEDSEGELRYQMLESIRQYAREKLAGQSGDEARAAQDRHLIWYRDLAEDAAPKLLTGDQVMSLDLLDREHDNLRAALHWGRQSSATIEDALRLAGALARFWEMRGYPSEGLRWLDDLLNTRAQTSPEVRARALYGAAMLAARLGDYARGAALAEESLAIFRGVEDPEGQALVLNLQGLISRNRADYERAQRVLEESLEISRRHGQTWALAEALNNLGFTLVRLGDLERAQTVGAEGLALWRELGDKRGLAVALSPLGIIARLQGQYDVARIRHEESLALQREIGHKLDIASSLISLGAVAVEQGERDRAAALFEESLRLCRDLGHKIGVASCLGNLAMIAHYAGDYAGARLLLEESKAIWKELDDTRSVAASTRFLAAVAHAQGDDAEAVSLYRESLGFSAPLGDRPGVAESLEGLAMVAVAGAGGEHAALLLGAAERLREVARYPVRPADRAEYEQIVAAARALADPAEFSSAWARGRALSLDEAVREALTAVVTVER